MSDIIIAPEDPAPDPVPYVPDWIETDHGLMDQNLLQRSVSVLYSGNAVVREIETWSTATGAVVKSEERSEAQPPAIS